MDAKEKLDRLTNRNAVLAAMAEFRQLGRNEFIKKYSQIGRGFGRHSVDERFWHQWRR